MEYPQTMCVSEKILHRKEKKYKGKKVAKEIEEETGPGAVGQLLLVAIGDY